MSDAGWVVTPKDSPAELAKGFEPDRYGTQAPLRNDTDEWLQITHRLSDADRAALSKVFNIANAILDNDAE